MKTDSKVNLFIAASLDGYIAMSMLGLSVQPIAQLYFKESMLMYAKSATKSLNVFSSMVDL